MYRSQFIFKSCIMDYMMLLHRILTYCLHMCLRTSKFGLGTAMLQSRCTADNVPFAYKEMMTLQTRYFSVVGPTTWNELPDKEIPFRIRISSTRVMSSPLSSFIRPDQLSSHWSSLVFHPTGMCRLSVEISLHQSFLLDVLIAASKLGLPQLESNCIQKLNGLHPQELLDVMISAYRQGITTSDLVDKLVGQ